MLMVDKIHIIKNLSGSGINTNDIIIKTLSKLVKEITHTKLFFK